MERAGETENLLVPRPLRAHGVQPRVFQGSLVRLGPAVAEKDRSERVGALREHGARECQRGLGGEQVRYVAEPAHLPHGRAGKIRAAVAQRVDGDPACKVEVAAACRVFQPHAPAARDDQELVPVLGREGEIRFHRRFRFLHFHSLVPCFPSMSRAREPGPSYCPMITFPTP